MSKLGLVASFASLIISTVALAHGGGSSCNGCAGHLRRECGRPDTHIMGSGQSGSDLLESALAADEIYGIMQRLGGFVPASEIRFANASDMAAIAMTGGHPAPHAQVGAQLLASAAQAAGIYEVVFSGEPHHQQYIRDTNLPYETRMVLAHVAGHYDFFLASPLFRSREADPIRASFELASLMSRLYSTIDKEEVAAFYQSLLTVQYLQDVTRGTYDAPESFVNGQVPPSGSRSLLQALVKNMPASAPAWKHEMISLFEQANRAAGASIQTKIMNEGWATIMEPLLLSHTRWRTEADAIAHGQMNAMVRRPGLDNPYWLGSEAWMRVRERFTERAEIRALSAEDQDRAFIAEGHRLIGIHNDVSFLRYALDDIWLARNGLFLRRHLEGKNYLAITRDPQRVIDYIINNVAERERQMPRIAIESFAGPDGSVLLRHEPVLGMPLKRSTMAQALYVIAKILDRPVTLATIQTTLTFDKKNAPHEFPLRVTAHPEGQVFVDAPAAPPRFMKNDFEGKLRVAVRNHRADLMMSHMSGGNVPTDLSRFESALLGAGGVDAATRFASHAPSASQAIMEYMRESAVRLYRNLRLAAQGKLPVDFRGNSVRVKVLPSIPHFELDRSVLAVQKRHRLQVQPDGRSAMDASATAEPMSPASDDDLDLSGGPYIAGDIFEDEPPKEDGEGQGDGDGDEDGEEQEGQPKPGSQPGQPGQDGGGDPAYAEVPIELFGQMLAQEIRLRNLRHTDGGESQDPEEVLVGYVRRPSGRMQVNQTARRIYEIGMARARMMARRGELDMRRVTPQKIMRLGLDWFRRDQQAVYDVEPEPVPEVDAVIIWERDCSGSISDEHTQIMSQAMANIRALLKSKYPYLKERFVVFNTEATEVTQEEFFTIKSSGGTTVVKGIEKMKEIFTEYPKVSYNRFGVVFTDGDDGSGDAEAKTLKAIEELSKDIEHFAYGHVDKSSDVSPAISASLSKKVKALRDSDPEHVGYAVIQQSFESIIRALREYYGQRTAE